MGICEREAMSSYRCTSCGKELGLVSAFAVRDGELLCEACRSMAPREVRQLAQSVFAYAADRLNEGAPKSQIEAGLAVQGIDRDCAAEVVARVSQLRAHVLREAANKAMIVGGVLLLVGVTLVALLATRDSWSLVFSCGVTLLGAVQFVRGAFQRMRARES